VIQPYSGWRVSALASKAVSGLVLKKTPRVELRLENNKHSLGAFGPFAFVNQTKTKTKNQTQTK
jgi:hypothetical protein